MVLLLPLGSSLVYIEQNDRDARPVGLRQDS